MAIVINGSGTVTGLAVGGLPDGTVDAGTLAANSVDSAELIDGSIDNSHLADNAVGLAEMASGTDGNIISYDASGNPVAIATGSDGQVLTSTGAGSPPAFEASAVGGKVLQVQQGILTGIMGSTTAATWVDVVTVNITPSSTSSKVYVSFNLNAMVISDNQRAGARVARNSTGIGTASSVGSRTAASTTFAGTSDGGLSLLNMSNSILDTPSTTSQITYRLQVQCENTTEIKINHDDADGNGSSYFRGVTTITAMEIAG